MDTEGVPAHSDFVFEPTYGDVWSTPVNVETESLMEPVSPDMFTETVLEPEAGFTKYHISDCIAPSLVSSALVKDCPL